MRFDMKFFGLARKATTIDTIKDLIADTDAKRINFVSTHANALHRDEKDNDTLGWLNLPFADTVEAVLKNEIGMGSSDRLLFDKKTGKGVYRFIKLQNEYDSLTAAINKYSDVVFIRDCLDLSVALSMNMVDDTTRTEVGELEYQVKYHSEERDVTSEQEQLISLMQQRLVELPYFNKADYICAVPSGHPFMKDIINGLKGFPFTDITDSVSWTDKKNDIKNTATTEEKLDLLEQSGLKISEELDLNGKVVLLVDDMYQSGVTMQYVAMKLKEAGVNRVFGMTLVKSLGNN